MKSLNKMKIIKFFCFIIIFLILLLGFQSVMQAKWVIDGKDNTASTSCWTEYDQLEKNSVDVLFVGTSHVLYDIDPMYMYNLSGVTSYVFSGPGLRLDLTSLVVEDVLKSQTPKVVFLDVSGVHYGDEQQTEAKCHKIADQLPLSLGKIEYAFTNGNEELEPLNVLFPFFRYHSRWSELTSLDFKAVTGDVDKTALRGHYISYEQIPAEMEFYDEVEFTLTDRNLKYLERISSTCKEKGIELVLFKVPSPQWTKAESDAVAAAAEELGLAFWDLTYEMDAIGIDPSMDFNDATDHLNQYGAEKLTTYMSTYLQENYNFEDHRGEYVEWDQDYKWYEEYKQDKLQDIKENISNEIN